MYFWGNIKFYLTVYLNFLLFLNGSLFNYLTLDSYFKYKYEIKRAIDISYYYKFKTKIKNL